MFGLKDKMLAMIGGGLAMVLLVALIWVTVSKNNAIGDLNNRITALEAEIQVAQNDLAICQGNTANLTAGIERQNAAVATLEAEGRVRDERGKAALAAVRRENEALAAATRAVIDFQPRPGEDICVAADRMIRESANAR